MLIIFGHNLCRMDSVYFVQTHDGSIIVQAHDGSIMCRLIKSMIMQISKKIGIPVLSDIEYHLDKCYIILSTRNKLLVQYTTRTLTATLLVIHYKMGFLSSSMIGYTMVLKYALLPFERQIRLCCNYFVGIDNISAIDGGDNISSLRMNTEVELSRSHEKKVFIITVQSHRLVLHHLCRSVCLIRSEVNGENSALDWSQFVSHIEVFIGDTVTSWGANNNGTSYVAYFSMSRENGELVSCSVKPKD